MALYIGFDCSTQSLAVIVIEAGHAGRRVVLREALQFDAALPHYGTRHGVIPSTDPQIVHAPPLMWAEALEHTVSRIVREIDCSAVRAISGSAQQHGSVYCSARASDVLASLADAMPLVAQLRPVFSRPTAPIWMDASTDRECREIEAALGGGQALAELTGSRAFPRFTGPQIRRFARQDPDAYQTTSRIHLVSSWLASLMIGAHAPIDHADGSGMNLMDIRTREWSEGALEATAPGLRTRLPALVPSSQVIGRLSGFWQARFGLPDARVVAWSGDNPCSLVGTGLVREGMAAVSLGTSDTIFGLMRDPRVSQDGTGHVFAAPTGDYMGITVFCNGSLARERIRDQFGLDWSGFSAALKDTPAGNHGSMMLPWFAPEITPPVPNPSPRTFGIDPADAAAHVRAVVEAQMLAMARHSSWMGAGVRTIYATGGAAANREVLQVMADVFDADVLRFDSTDSAALGAALRALHGDRLSSGAPLSWDDVVHGFAEPLAGTRVTPDPARVQTYRRMRAVYAEREAAQIQGT